ncbi:hypothetical protein SUGI_0387700, partial [Cryptomeria japonica]
IGDFVPFLERIGLGGSLDDLKSLHKRFDEFIVRKIEEKKRMPLPTEDDGNKDFLQILHQLKYNSAEERRQLSESNIKGILVDMISAGTDTATRTVEWATSELIRHPHLMRSIGNSSTASPNATYASSRISRQFKGNVMVNVWAIARDSNAWEKPLEFDPDRFVDNPAHFDGRDFRITPFGSGRRMCPGYNLGLCIIQFVLASFVHSFD